MNNFKKYIPILGWLPNYSKNLLRGDISAGLTVGVMLIPQGMAYALIAGLPPIYGLYASIIPLIIYAIFGTSRQLAVGPVAMVSFLVAAGIGSIAVSGLENYISLAILLALMVGVIQFSLGLFRLGFLVNFLSHPIISGFTSAAALIIAVSQIKHLLGINIVRSNFIYETLIYTINNIHQTHWLTLIIGACGIIIIVLSNKINKTIPAQLLAVIFGITVVWIAKLDVAGVEIVGEVPKGLPLFTIPVIELNSIKTLLPIAITIALIAYLESIAVAKALQAKHKNYTIDTNQELMALGLANIVGSFFKSFTTAGGFGRSAVNNQAGANTGLAAIISALLIALTLLFFTPLFYFLPKAILAAVIIVAVFGLIDVKEALNLWKSDKTDFAMLLATFLATLFIGIEEGIIVGVILSLVMVIYKSAYPHIAELGRLPNSNYYRNVKRFPEVEQRSDILIVRFDAPLFFANTGYFKDKLNELITIREVKPKLVILNAESISSIDSSAVHMLCDYIDECNKQQIDLYISGAIGPLRDKLLTTGLMDKIGKANLFLDVNQAVNYFDNQIKGDESLPIDKRAIQTGIN